MSLEIGDAISSGFEKLTTKAGLTLVGISLVLSLFSTLGSNTAIAALEFGEAAGPGMGQDPTLVLPIGLAGGAILALIGAIAGLVLTLIIIRTMAHPVSELDSLPHGVTDSLFKGTIFLFVTLFITGLATAIGFIFLIIPGIFLAVSFAFAQVFVAVEDKGPLQAISASWELSKGNRLSIFLLLLVIVGISIVVGLVTAIPSFVSPIVGTLVSLLISPFINVFTTAVIVDGYLQLTRDEAREFGGDETTATTTA